MRGTVEPHEYLQSLRKHWIVILTVTLLGLLGAYLLDHVIPTSYQAKSVVFVSASQGSNTSELLQGSTFTQNLVQSYAQLVSTPLVLKPVIDRLGLDTTPTALAGSVSADTPLNTVLIDITVTRSDPGDAADIANAVADSLAKVAEELSPSTTDDKPAITMSVVTPAHAPTAPSAPNSRLIYLSGILLGLLIGVAYAVLRELLDTRIRGDRDIARVTSLPILGTISRDKQPGISVLRDRQGRVAEDFRRVRINLEYVALDSRLRTVVVTSGLPSEGKTTVSLNLALALAERDQRVLLIDADLRRPSVHRYAQIDGTVGLTSVLLGNLTLAEAIQPWASGAIDVLPSGLIPPNPEQLLGSEPMARILAEVVKSYDMVVVDSPPILPVADTLSLSRIVDGVLVVARYGATRRPALSRTLESLASIHGPVAGIVLNSVRTRRSKHSRYYGYGSEEEVLHFPASLTVSEDDDADGDQGLHSVSTSDDQTELDWVEIDSVGERQDDISDSVDAREPADVADLEDAADADDSEDELDEEADDHDDHDSDDDDSDDDDHDSAQTATRAYRGRPSRVKGTSAFNRRR